MSIILGILTSIMGSIGSALRKKSSNYSTLPNGLFVLYGSIIGIFFIYAIIFVVGINTDIFFDYKIIGILVVAGIIDGLGSLFDAGIYKKVKISKILPYASFDKLFIILIGFILFYGKPGYTSITTLLIAIFTVLIIILFSVDFKNFKLEKVIIQYLGVKILYATATLIMGSVLLKYTTMDVFAVIIFVYLGFHSSLNFILKKDFSQMLKQTKTFYKYRFMSSGVGRAGFILGMFIIQTSGLLIASLLSFISIVFSVISMKIILNDTPTKKQVILAILVVIMIGIGYYFK